MMRTTKRLVLLGALMVLLGSPLLWAQTSGETGDSSPPNDLSHGVPQVDQALTNAIATLQKVLAELPAQANEKAREAIQRNIDRLQAGHDEAMESLRRSQSGQTPTLTGIDKAIDAIQHSTDKSTAQLKKLLDGGTLPVEAIPHLQAALGSLSQGRGTALEVLNQVRAGEQNSGTPETAGARRPERASRPERGQSPDRPQRPERPEHPSKP